ncbi:hypothetical protein AAMO2058_000158500 [Amorphochlora amoebiformis]
MSAKMNKLEMNIERIQTYWMDQQNKQKGMGFFSGFEPKHLMGEDWGAQGKEDRTYAIPRNEKKVTLDSFGVPNRTGSHGSISGEGKNKATDSKPRVGDPPKSDVKRVIPSGEERKWLENKFRSADNLTAREIFNDWKLKFHLNKKTPTFEFGRTEEQMHVASATFLSLKSKSKPQSSKKKAKDQAIMEFFRIYLDNHNLQL